LLVLAAAFLTRYVPRERPAERVWYDTVALDELPVSQWDSMISETENNHYILALTYNGKEWCRKTEVAKTCGTASKHSSAAHPGTPASAPTGSPPTVASGAIAKINGPASGSVAVPSSNASKKQSPTLPPLPPMPGK
jgi:hypothetical protein